MKITGVLKTIKDIEKINDNFKVRKFIVTDNSKMIHQDIQFELIQDECGKTTGFTTGTTVTVEFEIKSSLYKERYYYTMIARSIKAS